MTAIYIWPEFNGEKAIGFRVAGDTAISGGREPLTESGVKVFNLPVICRSPGASGFFTEIYFDHSYGMAFAGSTLIAQNVYLEVLPLLINMISPEKATPSLKDVANYVGNFIDKIWKEYGQIKCNLVEIAIFGYCHVEKKFIAVHFSPKPSGNGAQIQQDIYEAFTKETYIYLGDAKDKLQNILEKEKINFCPDEDLSKLYLKVIKTAIESDDKDLNSIRGGIQLGLTSQFGYHLMQICEPIEVGKPEAQFRYLNYVMEDKYMKLNQSIRVSICAQS